MVFKLCEIPIRHKRCNEMRAFVLLVHINSKARKTVVKGKNSIAMPNHTTTSEHLDGPYSLLSSLYVLIKLVFTSAIMR